MTEKQFPIHASHNYILASIPWSLAEAKRKDIEARYFKDTTGITLEGIANAGGIDLFMLASVLADKPVHCILRLKPEVAVAIVYDALLAHERAKAKRRGKRFIDWGLETFGLIVLSEVERALRFVEEALELVQAAGVTKEQLYKLIERVYSRASGGTDQEAGQCLLTLEGLCHVLEVDLEDEARKEWDRVHTIPKEEWQKRHAAKEEAGLTA